METEKTEQVAQQVPQYPFLTIAYTEQGILLTTHVSAWKKENQLIPVQNADAMCIGWIATRPKEVLKMALQAKNQAETVQETIDNVMKNPRGPTLFDAKRMVKR